jgi:hypothetical protein
MSGADPKRLQSLIEKHQGPNTDTLKSYHVPGQMDISHLVNKAQLDGLNQHRDHTVQQLFTEEGYLESEVDPQLMITIPFQQAVRLHSLKFIPVEGMSIQ